MNQKLLEALELDLNKRADEYSYDRIKSNQGLNGITVASCFAQGGAKDCERILMLADVLEDIANGHYETAEGCTHQARLVIKKLHEELGLNTDKK